jgi:predicted RNA-binding protein with EMAP domain
MLGYEISDQEEMITAVQNVKEFYLKYPSDLIDKKKVIDGLNKAEDLLQGLWAEGYFD